MRVPIDDPVAASGTPEEVREAFRTGREEVRAIVQAVVDGRLGPAAGDRPDSGPA